MTDPFSIGSFSFPKNFIFGSATSGHQIEGNNIHSNNWQYEFEQNAINPKWELSGKACNSYEMWNEDNELLSKLGHQMYRMSMEWSRIEPEENVFDSSALDHYIKIFEDLKNRKIKICLSLVHGSVPNWFFKKQWFYNIENLKYFEKYLEYVLPKIANYVDYWITLNEPNSQNDPQYFDFKFNAVIYHARANSIIKKYSSKPVSLALMMVQQYAKRQWDTFDVTMQNYFDLINNEFFFHAIRTGELVLPYRDALISDEIKNSCDYWAINSYRRKMIDCRKANFVGTRYRHEKMQLMKEGNFGDTFNAECLIHNLTRLTDKPVLISENGSVCDNDDFRIVFILEYLSAVSEAIDMGVNVIGYLYWSLLDNYEWSSFAPKFGLVSVDRNNNFKRTIKNSGYFYKDIIEKHGYTKDLLTKYIKALPKVEYLQDTIESSPTGKQNKYKAYLGEL